MSKLQYQHWKHVLQSSCCSLYSPCKGNFSSQVHCHMVHCKDTIPKIWNKYSQERNCAASVPSSTSMCLWAIYVFPGRAMPFLGIHKWDFRCSVRLFKLFFLLRIINFYTVLHLTFYILCTQARTYCISCSRIDRSIVGIYKSLTDTWMWKLGLRPRYSFPGNICFKFSAFCLCSAWEAMDKLQKEGDKEREAIIEKL